MHCTTLRCTTLHPSQPHYTASQCTTPHQQLILPDHSPEILNFSYTFCILYFLTVEPVFLAPAKKRSSFSMLKKAIKSSITFGGNADGNEKCPLCLKAVFRVERIICSGASWHKSCFGEFCATTTFCLLCCGPCFDVFYGGFVCTLTD